MNGLDVRPGLSTDDSGNSDLRYAKQIGKINLPIVPGLVQTSKIDNLRFDQHRCSNGRPFGLTPFRNLVGLIVYGGTDKEIGRLAAWRVIAMMTDAHPGRYRSICQRPRRHMGAGSDVMMSKNAVPVIIRWPRPLQTSPLGANQIASQSFGESVGTGTTHTQRDLGVQSPALSDSGVMTVAISTSFSGQRTGFNQADSHGIHHRVGG